MVEFLGAERLIGYQDRAEPVNPDLYNEVVARLPAPEYADSLEALAPDVAVEWDFERNGFLLPSMFTPGSDQKVFWKCSECGHSWPATIKHRTIQSSGCPKCAVRRSRGPRLPKKICPNCKLEFQPRMATQKHCSAICGHLSRRKIEGTLNAALVENISLIEKAKGIEFIVRLHATLNRELQMLSHLI